MSGGETLFYRGWGATGESLFYNGWLSGDIDTPNVFIFIHGVIDSNPINLIGVITS